MTLLEIERVTKRFGEMAAVNDLSFEVEQGEVFGIAGPNGAGKTTLFNVIAGRLRSSGEIIFDGRKINGLKPHQICHMGISRTFQIPTLFTTMTVSENVGVGAHFGAPKGTDYESNKSAAIDFLGLQGKENVEASSLGLFHKRLTMLGAALATKPRLLLLDEPIGGLSPIEIRQSMSLIRKINSELGVTVLVIEHLMKVLREVCDRLMIIHDGELICIGPPEEVIRDSKTIEVYLGTDYA